MTQYEKIFLRSAVWDDVYSLYEWSNSDEVRKVSINNSKFCFESHKKWFEECLNNSQVKILIAEDSNDYPVGQIRFNQIDELNAEVHVNTRPELTGLGIGTKIIRIGTEKYLETTEVLFINALILKSNLASIKAFKKADYRFRSNISSKGKSLIKLTKFRIQK